MNRNKYNECKSMRILRKLLCICGVLTILCFYSTGASVKASAATGRKMVENFAGAGTKEKPYLIETAEDLKNFRDLVNSGNEFEDTWFLQTSDIDLELEEWTPIGCYQSGHYFYGIYNGGGHVLYNLKISDAGNAGLFGQLAGVVLNLGVESGNISGDCVGSIASHSVPGTQPAIIQCYSKASVNGVRAGGIADNFSGGYIVRCWYNGLTNEKTSDNIVSYAGQLIECYADNEGIAESAGEVYTLVPHNKAEKTKLTVEAQENGCAAFVACKYVDYDSVIPWEWNGEELQFSKKKFIKPQIDLLGSGTKDDPYVIADYEDLSHFRDLVNIGYTFEGCWVVQTSDIAMETDDWIPIGIYGTENYFWGVYDGAGHTISNIRIQNHQAGDLDNSGLFGQLGGIVANLGIENGLIEGNCSGGIASHSAGKTYTAGIVNCYSKVDIKAQRAGGIADNFDFGKIIACWNDSHISVIDADKFSLETGIFLNQTYSAGITTAERWNDTKVYGCLTTGEQAVTPSGTSSKTSGTIYAEELYTEKTVYKMNWTIALAQQLFANDMGIQLRQLKLNADGEISFSNETAVIRFVAFINEYAAPIVLAFILVLLSIHLRRVRNSGMLWETGRKGIVAGAIIFASISLFVDCALIGSARHFLTLGSGIFIALSNIACVACVILIWKNSKKNWKAFICENGYSLIGFLVVMLLLVVLQSGKVPRYDGGIYYGSLVQAVKLFRLDLLTYIGGFVIWQWCQGTGLLLAPLEFIFPGRVYGFYCMNALIMGITMVVFYRLLRETVKPIRPFWASVVSFALIVCPYQLGMLSHFCLDAHLTYYIVWLMYCYKHKNDMMISFCGFLLCFTKVTGAVFYVAFMIMAGITEVLREYRGSLISRIFHWWKWKRCILWIFPAILYVAAFLGGDKFIIQNFNGVYTPDTMIDINKYNVADVILQSSVFCLRWVVVLLSIAALCVVFIRPERLKRVLNREDFDLMLMLLVATASLLFLLIIYKSDASLPRYTAAVNVLMMYLLPVSVFILTDLNWQRNVVIVGMGVLLLIQTYWSIDPVFLVHTSGVNTGKTVLHRMAVGNDSRAFMNLGADYETGYTCIGDLYAYNNEFYYYQSLFEDALKQIQPTEKTVFCSLDLPSYDMAVFSSQYRTYWNTRMNKVTFDLDDADNITLNDQNMILTREICETSIGELNLWDDFYLYVQARVDSTEAISRLMEEGYKITEEFHPENFYGSMSVYHFEKSA